MYKQFIVLAAAAAVFYAVPVQADMHKDINKAAQIIEQFRQVPEDSIPPYVLENCKGLAVLSVGKAGFIVSGRGGSGIVIAKTSSGWSAPSSIGIGGGGFGFQIGAQITDFVLVLNTDAAVKAFSEGGNVSLGGNLSVSAGPVGRTAEGDVAPVAAVYSYSRSKGAFAGASLEGTLIVEGVKRNEAFYKKPVKAAEILSGNIPAPASAAALYKALGK